MLNLNNNNDNYSEIRLVHPVIDSIAIIIVQRAKKYIIIDFVS